jgi:hypothetical protein
MGCLIALFARLALLVVWVSTPLVNRAFHGAGSCHCLGSSSCRLPPWSMSSSIISLEAWPVGAGSGSSWHSFSTWERIVPARTPIVTVSQDIRPLGNN